MGMQSSAYFDDERQMAGTVSRWRRRFYLEPRAGKYRIWRLLQICLAGSASIIILAGGFHFVGFNLQVSGFLLLIPLALFSIFSGFFESIFLSFVAVAAMTYFLATPYRSFEVERQEDIAALIAFLSTSLIVFGIAVDGRRRAEQKLRQTRLKLERFARVATLGELTAGVAHEVNQPLASVVSSGNACHHWLAVDPPNLERAKQSLDRIIRDANRASAVVERLRGLVNNAPAKRIPINLNEAVSETILLARPRIRESGISLRTTFSENLPLLTADKIQLQQVCLNLIVNAIDAMAGSSGQRILSVGTQNGETSDIVVNVGDTGCGLHKDTTDAIYDAFYTTKQESMGMGLAISRSIVEAHGGRLWAIPNKPRGTIFQFSLPLKMRH
jgi:C4-dicarboxylate-specific signal transduction histidine kinase